MVATAQKALELAPAWIPWLLVPSLLSCTVLAFNRKTLGRWFYVLGTLLVVTVAFSDSSNVTGFVIASCVFSAATAAGWFVIIHRSRVESDEHRI